MADQTNEDQRIRAAQKVAATNALKSGGLVLGADQAHAIGISAALNKLKGIDDLTDTNFIGWLLHQKSTKSIEFLFSRMDESNSTRFRAALDDLEIPLIRQLTHPTEEELAANPNARPCTTGRLVPEISKRPAHLWTIVKEYHQSDNEASLYLIQSKLNKFQQHFKTSITAHIDAFIALKHEFINRGGYVDESQLGRQLLHSLDDSHLPEVKITSRSVINALKSYEDNNQNLKISSKSKNTDIAARYLSILVVPCSVQSVSEYGPMSRSMASLIAFWLRRTARPIRSASVLHPAKDCFKKTKNRKAEKEWFESRGFQPPNRVNLAKPKEPEPTTESPGIATHTSTSTAPRQMHYVFMAYGNEVNLVHPKFEAIWDTGASSHMFNDYSFFKNVNNNSQKHSPIMTAGSEELTVEAKGEVVVKGVTIETITLCDSLYIPALWNNLIAASALKQKGSIEVSHPTDPSKFIIAFNRETFLRGQYVNNVMVVTVEPVSNPLINNQIENPQADQSNHITDHNRLGHINPKYLQKTTEPYTHNPLENIHIDLSGIIRIPCIFDYSYFMLIINEYSRMAFIFFLKSKTKEEVFSAINSFITRAERHCDRKVKMITTDGGSEFINSLLIPFCESLGIVKNTTAPYTPQQNGLVERFMRTISTKVRSLILQSGISTCFCSLACGAAVYIQNCVFNRARNGLPHSPYELWYGHKPNINYIHTFGCLSYVHNRKEQMDNKFSPTARKGFLLGFDEFNRNYLVFDYGSHKIVNVHDVTFDENVFPEREDDDPSTFEIEQEEDIILPEPTTTTIRPDESDSESEPNIIDDVAPENPTIKVIPPKPPIDHPNNPQYVRRSSRISQLPRRTYLTAGKSQCNNTEFNDPKFEPRRFKDIQNSRVLDRWIEACNNEIKNMKDKGVYSLQTRPRNRKVIKGRWVFKVKMLPDGTISKYKARFVAKGYTQEEGVDFDQTFSPTGKPSSLRLLVTLATRENWVIEQMDAVSAFLNSNLDEEIYLEQPEGFEKGGKDMVWRLHKSIYGLKQSARLWHLEVEKYLKKIGFTKTEADPCVFYRNRGDISFSVGVLSRFLDKPNQQHWDAFTHVLRYLKFTINHQIRYDSRRLEKLSANPSWNFPEVASNVDWAGDKSTLRSTTGYVFKFMSGAISWKSRLQPTVALSSTEAEYRAITEAGQEALWLIRLMKEIEIPVQTPLELICDNLSAIHLAQNPVHHGRIEGNC
ncbi:hypothetical protein MJO29_016913 [Puccinia striiformis f. sp. tritici]|nr:hypothetical protein MJO29_016913 [Puccinia striiformis f. sp. tritici]